MSWQHAETLPWAEPLTFAADFAAHEMALLYSGLSEKFTGQDSYLFLDPLEEISGRDWAQLPSLPSSVNPPPLWVGYLGYGMRDTGERGTPSPITLPDFRLVRYGTLYHFEHTAKTVKRYQADIEHNGEAGGSFSLLREKEGPAQREDEGPFPQNPTYEFAATDPHPTLSLRRERASLAEPVCHNFNISSNLIRAEYESIVTDTVEQIRDGNFYQANITRKFFGEFASPPDSFSLFQKLCEASPAPYSAYIKHGASAILSSSPECFLSIDANGVMTTRPIKGSARRSADAMEDARIAEALTKSEKNHAENLMIVDLMRNDLSRVAEPETVRVEEQSALYSYARIHHLISTIRAQKRADVSVYDAVRACFPAGSMTGAPKIAAMKWCTEQEKLERGVYSGVIGWFGANNTCDLSVVIRTLILQGNRFEFQVGGGIVVDSTPEEEWRETLTKARGVCTALGVSEEELANL